MLQYIFKRLVYGVVVLVFVVMLITSIIYLSPVDPARLTFGQRTDIESVELKKVELGLDKSLPQQMLLYLKDISPLAIYKDIDSLKYEGMTTEKVGKDTLEYTIENGVVEGVEPSITLRRVKVDINEKDSLIASYKAKHSLNEAIPDSNFVQSYQYILTTTKQVPKTSIFAINNKEKYGYAKLFPVGGGSYFTLKVPYLRTSFQSGEPVLDILWRAIPKTAVLALAAIFLGTFVGIFLGVLASLRQNSWFDNSAVIASVLGYSLPSYVSAAILAYIFGYLLSDWTGLSVQGSLIETDDMGNDYLALQNLILPAIALGIRPIALVTQLTRSAMLEVLSQDYIRTAKAKGLSNRKVIFKHALRNALNPVVTAITGWFAALLAGAFFVENVFSYKGLGYETVQALIKFDVPVVLGCVLFAAAVFVIINILIDILYAVIDPRVTVK